MVGVEDVAEEAEEGNCLNSAKLADFYVRYLFNHKKTIFFEGGNG
jgi:hypothetical protein